MPELVRVRVKETGALIWVSPVEINDTVERCPVQPSRTAGLALPKPHRNLPRIDTTDYALDESTTDLPPALPDAIPSDEDGEPEEKPAGRPSGNHAGTSGTKKEGSDK